MQEQMQNFLERLKIVQNGLSVSAFARQIGMNQKTVDLYMKGERKPSVEFITSICSSFGISADWLLGLPDRSGGAVVTGSSGVAIATGGGSATVSTPQPSCQTCPYKALAEALKKVQAL